MGALSRPPSLTTQLSLSLFALGILATLLTGGGLIALNYQSEMNQLATTQRERSQLAAVQIDAYMDDLQRKLGYLARVPGLAELSAETHHALLTGLARHNSAYEAIAILDGRGRIVAGVSPYGSPNWDAAALAVAFDRSYRLAEDYASAVAPNPRSPLPTIMLSVPIRDGHDRIGGVLVARVNLSFLWNIVSMLQVGQSGYAYVLDDRNYLVARKGEEPETFRLRDVSQRPFIVALTTADDPPATYRGLTGEEVLGAIAPIRSVRWNVVAELPTREAFAPLRTMMGWMALALFVAIAVGIGLGALFSRRVVSPLRQLTDAARRISGGELDVKVSVPSENELGVLAGAFNKMTAELLGLIDHLEHRVAERTRELRLAYEHLQELDRLKSNFVNSVTHELRTPLTSIMGYAEFLEDEIGGKLSGEQLNFVHEIERSSLRLEFLLNDLLDYARLEAGTFRLNLDEAEFVTRAHEVIDSLVPQANGAQVQIETEFSAPFHELTMDDQRVGQVLLNLLSNAIKFSPRGGRIVVRTRQTGDRLLCEVEDEGPGIAPEDLPRLFQRFSQLDLGVRQGKGTGLGLSISKAIVEAHGGEIGVRSTPGVGSTFWFTLPLQPSARPPAAH